jgi:hypothetical protein
MVGPGESYHRDELMSDAPMVYWQIRRNVAKLASVSFLASTRVACTAAVSASSDEVNARQSCGRVNA